MYRNVAGVPVLMHDKCPHQGASLSRGKVTDDGRCLQCPYHGFKFSEGSLVCLGGGRTCSPTLKISVPVFQTLETEDMIFACLDCNNLESVPPPFYPPEEMNTPMFRKISGEIRIQQDSDLVTENVLDMLHISYVHSFGNRGTPLPSNIHFTRLDAYSGRSFFEYVAGATSISRVVGKVDRVVVENEYYLPSTTITRVVAGDLVKTVMTRALRVSPNETVLFWTVYRNFWNSNAIEDFLGDKVMNFFMEKTLAEDVDLLKGVYRDRGNFYTEYDVTIRNFRRAKGKLQGL
jgi:phenylpropionate dioxygenase-like ring-hydroxylating dioxygenase large terminal subunit